MIKDQALNYLESNEDWQKHVSDISDNTQVMNDEIWVFNAKKNRKLIKEAWLVGRLSAGSPCGQNGDCYGCFTRHKKPNRSTLRDIQYDPDFILCSVTSGLKYLLENGVTPKYNMIADADPSQVRFWEGLDMGLTKGITLISSVTVPQNMLDMWEGDIKFIAFMSGDKKLKKKLERWVGSINGCGHFFHALLGQFNGLVAIANLIFCCNVTILVGNELSFADEDVPYYADREDVKDCWERLPCPDIYGNMVYTSQMFMSLKLALEDYTGKLPGWIFNCTEAGIFGVSKRYGNLPWIHQLTLQNGIAQARNIMRSGEPFYA